MKNLVGTFFVEVNDKNYTIHPTENILFRECKKPKNIKFQYQVNNVTQIGRNQTIFGNKN